MAIFKRNFISATNWVLTGILGVFGFSCNKNGVDMYGAPHADFVLKGSVLDKTTSKPLKDIQVVVQYDFYEDLNEAYITDTVRTDAGGMFESMKNTPGAEAIRVITTDTGMGVFEADTSFVSFKNATFTGSKGWYQGRAEEEITIYLDKKEE